ncbi:YigZ family protein [Amphritea sp. 1_MG-2023]|uniref:YigZ family protein n=1 Tax=Amphritea sp. 1_MG-2023 TaxID=3062670 RepID=UPI0026E137B2|nr:YigZ family protein [Amphritea sp. 1_MG-2023]MDO6563505.1 YigZ family protein [Amphritea sp. 1_MG-2023]
MANDIGYRRPAQPQHIELEIRKSRFICDIQPVNDRPAAMQFIASIQAMHPKANHHCWSYIAGRPDDAHQWNYSDDGEPKGTAGQPMFNVIHHSDLGNICAVVTRYFGGIKLGTGGIARAYSQAVQQALQTLTTETVIPTQQIVLVGPYDLTGELEQLIHQFQLTECQRQFGTGIEITAQLATHQIAAFEQALTPFQHKIDLTIS